jgi:hypothetical protein
MDGPRQTRAPIDRDLAELVNLSILKVRTLMHLRMSPAYSRAGRKGRS